MTSSTWQDVGCDVKYSGDNSFSHGKVKLAKVCILQPCQSKASFFMNKYDKTREPGIPTKTIKAPSLVERLNFFEKRISIIRGVTDHDKGLVSNDKQS